MDEEIQDVIDDVNGQFAEAAAAHPEFAGVSAIFCQGGYFDGTAYAYPDGLSTQFLTDLGFVIPPELDQYSDGFGQAELGLENLSVLNSGDVLLWATDDDTARAQLEAEAVYRQLTPVQQGNLAFTDRELAAAIYFTSPLSLPYVLERLVPMLVLAVEGNPETIPDG